MRANSLGHRDAFVFLLAMALGALLGSHSVFDCRILPFGAIRARTVVPAISKAQVQRSRQFAVVQQRDYGYKVREEGEPQSLRYRAFLVDESGRTLSPWHDVPLRAAEFEEGVFNCVVEIPKGTSAKMEVATDELFTPIKQDITKNRKQLRFYPYHLPWNYGLLPQTWEDPNRSNAQVEGAFGDNDPLDVVEIGERRANVGDVIKVKPVAVLAMIDEGELDWKVVAISADDPKARSVNNESDVEQHFPGTLTAIRDWFRDYKVPDGKPQNRFGLGNKAAGKDQALKVIEETHQAWINLVTRSVPAAGLALS